MDVVKCLTDEDLTSMGITAIGIRKKIKIYAEKYVGVKMERSSLS